MNGLNNNSPGDEFMEKVVMERLNDLDQPHTPETILGIAHTDRPGIKIVSRNWVQQYKNKDEVISGIKDILEILRAKGRVQRTSDNHYSLTH